MNYIIFGGSGFIGTHLIRHLSTKCLNEGDMIYIVDLKTPKITTDSSANIKFIRCDIRNIIDFPYSATKDDIIFNLAAIHRTPGHKDFEYYETNILGAQNVVRFAEKKNFSTILFTSSIAVYGASEEKKFEETLLTPNTPYGISKVIAENIHEKWQLKDQSNRSLTIVRPGVVFGEGENGNFSRMIKSLKGNYFFYPGRKDTIKACIYVKELVNFIIYRVLNYQLKETNIFNCTYEPALTTQQICETIKLELNIKRRTFVIPSYILLFISALLAPVLGKTIGIHPQRVKKLMISTNISGTKMQKQKNFGYKEAYDFKSAIKDLVDSIHLIGRK